MLTILVESYEESVAFGAKSIAEIGINCALPAIASTIYDTVWVRLHHVAFTAEKILNAIKKLEKEKTIQKVSLGMLTITDTPVFLFCIGETRLISSFIDFIVRLQNTRPSLTPCFPVLS